MSIKCDYPSSREYVIEQLLEVTTASVKKLIIKIDLSCQSTRVVLNTFKKLLNSADHPLPSVINILIDP